MPKISIITGNLDSPDWARLLIESIRKFSTLDYEIIVADHGSNFLNLLWLKNQEDIKLLESKKHGRGWAIKQGLESARSPYVCFMDVDSFVMRKGWDEDLVKLYDSDCKIKLISHGGKKPRITHPSLLFFERDFVKKYRISFYSAERAIKKIQNLGYRARLLGTGSKPYKGKADEYLLNRKPTFYHVGYGTQFREHNPPRKLIVGNYKIQDYFKARADLWQKPLVREILEINERMAEHAGEFKGYLACRSLMLLNNGLPWLESEAIEFTRRYINRDSIVLDVGSGSSTIWFAQHSRFVRAFEHSKCWHCVVRDELDTQALTNYELFLRPKYPDRGLPNLRGKFDVILIDGPTRDRTTLIKDTINHIKSGGLFIVDDAQREEYSDDLKLLNSQGWIRHDFNSDKGMRVTSVWVVD